MQTVNKTEQPEFIRRQYEFAAHIRDPEKNPAPTDVEQRRMKIYNELFYNNVEGFMSNSFPVIHSILGETAWHELIRDYFSKHLSHTPLFPEMPREFLKYLENDRKQTESDPAFLLELAHYEWVELALGLLDLENDISKIDSDGELLDNIPIMSSLAWSLSYNFPVHNISPEFQPQHQPEQATYIVVYRDIHDKIVFMELNPVTARLLQLINETENSNNAKTGRELLEIIANEMNHPDSNVVINGGLQAMQELRSRKILLGTFKN
ncbi:FIG005107: hypothetical protein [hydrothermal vent metagenome]|uniref:Uncharacterized protein n=1 Tax=hydrothermal vent metagenome TaxID=652676 RepID=A0A3B1AFM1_9ZZZZ